MALESFWSGKSSERALLDTAIGLRAASWVRQKSLGVTIIPSNDFSLYDQVLDTSMINPDCGLKTRKWEEVRPALVNMVAAAREMRVAS